MVYSKKQVKKLLHEQRKQCAFSYGKQPGNATADVIYQAIIKTPLIDIENHV